MNETTEREAATGQQVPHERVVINRCIYHYHAIYQIDHLGQIVNIDGIALLDNRIVDMSGYAKLKSLIDADHAKKLTITGLSFLGMEKGL